jgi:hypothetical protein
MPYPPPSLLSGLHLHVAKVLSRPLARCADPYPPWPCSMLRTHCVCFSSCRSCLSRPTGSPWSTPRDKHSVLRMPARSVKKMSGHSCPFCMTQSGSVCLSSPWKQKDTCRHHNRDSHVSICAINCVGCPVLIVPAGAQLPFMLCTYSMGSSAGPHRACR